MHVKLLEWLWGHHNDARQPTSNSLSSKEERLAEYKELVLDHHKTILTNRRDDPAIKYKVAAWDPRFPNYDITNWCYTSYEDHFRCKKLRGEDYEPCEFFKNVYMQVCPNYMIERFDNARANGSFLPNV